MRLGVLFDPHAPDAGEHARRLEELGVASLWVPEVWGYDALTGLAHVAARTSTIGLGTFVVQLFSGNQLAMFLGPCAIGGFFILVFAVTLKDRRLARADKPTWSLREFASTFYVNPRKSPDFAWAFGSRFMVVLAYAFLTTYQAYYLLDRIGSAEAHPSGI